MPRYARRGDFCRQYINHLQRLDVSHIFAAQVLILNARKLDRTKDRWRRRCQCAD